MDQRHESNRNTVDLLTDAIAHAASESLTQLYVRRGHLYESLGDTASSVRDFLHALDTADSPSDITHIRSMIALALAKQNEKEQALFWAISAVDEDSSNPEAHHTMGLICDFCGFVNMAIESLKSAIKLDPHRWESIRVLGSCLRESGRVPESIETLSRYVMNNPAEPQGLYELAWSVHVCPGENNLHRAKELYEQALKSDPSPNLRAIIDRKLQDISSHHPA